MPKLIFKVSINISTFNIFSNHLRENPFGGKAKKFSLLKEAPIIISSGPSKKIYTIKVNITKNLFFFTFSYPLLFKVLAPLFMMEVTIIVVIIIITATTDALFQSDKVIAF
ncbi:hypothetical protein SDC9_192800 [bioreactor metagenome]|uniref:Uncharacterized protein n=1 Tax=bioreactor metagenome TaxID=1076179 RepID=A0A645ICS1_9ZZZZ